MGLWDSKAFGDLLGPKTLSFRIKNGVLGSNSFWRLVSCLKNWGPKMMLPSFKIEIWGPGPQQRSRNEVLSRKLR